VTVADVTISIRRVARVEARVEPYEWRWLHENRDLVAAHWSRRRAAQPRLFNGPILLSSDRRFVGDTLHIRFFRTDYAALLALTELVPSPTATGSAVQAVLADRVANAFALGALRAADGAFVLGVMGGHTANAGRAYFPAGTPDPADVAGDEVDLLGSAVRELHEETGLGSERYTIGQGWTVVEAGRMVALFRPIGLQDDAATVERMVVAHLARDAEAELSGIRVVRGIEDLDERVMPAYLVAYLRDAFSGGDPPAAASGSTGG
jgi:8-oxo-dGTP pyrophosphatase MutT (NUDIX family)